MTIKRKIGTIRIKRSDFAKSNISTKEKLSKQGRTRKEINDSILETHKAIEAIQMSMLNNAIQENIAKAEARGRAARPTKTGPKGVAAPDLPTIMDFLNDEETYMKECGAEIDRYAREKQTQLQILFLRFGLKQDDWKGLALALAETHEEEYRTNAKSGAKEKRLPLLVLEKVLRYAVEYRVGVNQAAKRLYKEPKDFKAYETIRATYKDYWQKRKDDYGLR